MPTPAPDSPSDSLCDRLQQLRQRLRNRADDAVGLPCLLQSWKKRIEAMDDDRDRHRGAHRRRCCHTTSSCSSMSSMSSSDESPASPPPCSGFPLRGPRSHPRLERQQAVCALSAIWSGFSSSPPPSPEIYAKPRCRRHPGKIVTARIESFLKVGDLINLLKEKHPSIVPCEAADVTLWVAKKKDGSGWLKSNDVHKLVQGDDIMKIHQNKMHVAYRLSNAVFGFPEEDDADAEDGAIHMLVAVPDLESRESAKEPHPARKRRWDVLNDLLESNKRAKSDPAEASTDFPYDEVNNIVQVGSYEQLWKPIPDENLEVVQEYLAMLTEALGSSLCANERKHYILPVLTCVCTLFDGDARIWDQVTISGNRVHGQVTFDFVIERGSKRVCVVEAKRDHFRQGQARAYVGGEALMDVEGLTEVFREVWMGNWKEMW
ncbi:Crinkler effector protein 5 [Phytophthora ramorum]|uniref:Crinkler effector protein 5 n=1 Tax=Phytophthora ramorum TaxID=164328 RepID=UPI0030B5CFAC|nr:Crinkler effector protein 5 [Phytophthora ramorum]